MLSGDDRKNGARRRLARGGQASEIADTLRAEIVSGTIPPGTRLGQDALARRFGVSRMPVREALRQLEAQGLLDVPSNRSAVVAPLSRDDLLDIFDLRVVTETLALGLALPHLTDASLERAERLQDRIEAAPLSQFGSLNAEFHGLLYEPCGRPRLLAQIDGLARLSDRYLRVAAGPVGQKGRSDAEHRALLAACRVRDRSRSRTILESHIAGARDALAEAFAARDEPTDGRPRRVIRN